MRFSKDEQKVIQELFQPAYARKERVEVGDRWQANVMRRIRNRRPKVFLIGFEQFLWRLAPAACLIIVVLAVVLFRMAPMLDDTVFQVLMNGEEELTISQFVGV